MANEKNWSYNLNVDLNDGSTTDLNIAQKWMYNLWTTISGGNGNATAAWDIVSCSNGTTAAAGGGLISSATDFVWSSGTGFSWFIAKKDGLIPTGSLYMMIGCNKASDLDYNLYFDYNVPQSDGDENTLPTANAAGTAFNNTVALSNDQFILGYNAGLKTYFSSIIDTTGSFYAFSSRFNATGVKNQFGLAAVRLETPRSSSVDPYPVFLKNGYWNTGTGKGVAQQGPWSFDYTSNNAVSSWNVAKTGQAMWRADGTDYSTDDIMLQVPLGDPGGYNTNPFIDFDNGAGSSLDGTWPLYPTYVYHTAGGAIPYAVRGRLPDISPASWNAVTSIEGAVTPAVAPNGEKSVISHWWFPATGSILPGTTG